jgi:hypothetical protein
MSKTLVNPNILFHRHNPVKLSNKCSASDNMKKSRVFIICTFYVPCTIYILIYITNCTCTKMHTHPTLAKLHVSARHKCHNQRFLSTANVATERTPCRKPLRRGETCSRFTNIVCVYIYFGACQVGYITYVCY